MAVQDTRIDHLPSGFDIIIAVVGVVKLLHFIVHELNITSSYDGHFFEIRHALNNLSIGLYFRIVDTVTNVFTLILGLYSALDHFFS